MVEIHTAADGILEELTKSKERKLALNKLSGKVKVDGQTIERWAEFLSDYIKITYPTNLLSKPQVILIKDAVLPIKIMKPSGELLSSYSVSADKVSAQVNIIKNEGELVPLYQVQLPEIGPGTLAILKGLADDLIKKVPITVDDLSDQRKMAKLKDVFNKEAEILIQKEFEKDITKNPTLKDVLSGVLLHNCYGLGTVELLMHDDALEEITINSSHMPLGAYHIKHGWVRTNVFFPSEKEVFNLSSQIARKSGTNLTNLTPLMDAHLLTGDRANATLFPISSFGNTLTIRKFARVPWTLIRLLKPEVHTISLDMAALLWLCMQYELNVLVTGGTASGKTSMLNAISALIPTNHRIISIEQTRELNLPGYLHWNWIPLVTRNANPEGKGEVTMLDLVTNSLRMRPDRIIMGEVRRKEEAEVLFEAMHTGHSVYSTVHADTSQHLVRRMTKPPFDLPLEDVQALDLVIVQFRDRKRGLRRTLEIAEVVYNPSEDTMNLNYLYRWDARTDSFEQVNESKKLYDKLNLYTGMTNDEIRADLKEKKEVLEWMVKNDAEDIDSMGQIVGDYYRNPKELLKKMRGGTLKVKLQRPLEVVPEIKVKTPVKKVAKLAKKKPAKKKTKKSKKK